MLCASRDACTQFVIQLDHSFAIEEALHRIMFAIRRTKVRSSSSIYHIPFYWIVYSVRFQGSNKKSQSHGDYPLSDPLGRECHKQCDQDNT